MPVRVAEIQRLADEVIGQAGHRHAVAGGMRQPAGEVGPLGHQQREVIEAGGTRHGPCARLLDQHQQLVAAGAQHRPRAALVEHLQADRLAVERERAAEVGHGQVHGADRCQR